MYSTRTLICPAAMLMAAAEVNPLITGRGMKSIKQPVEMQEDVLYTYVHVVYIIHVIITLWYDMYL